MKVIDVCQTPLLSSEVYGLIREDPRNAPAFDHRDPLENPDITDADDLRKFVAAKRTCLYLENCLSIQDVRKNLLPSAISVLRSYGLTIDQIVRLVDASVLTGSSEGALIYITAILRDQVATGSISQDQLASIQGVLMTLTGKWEDSDLEKFRHGALAEEIPPPAKKRTSSRRSKA